PPLLTFLPYSTRRSSDLTTADVMDQVIGFHLNRGVLAVADRAAPVPWERLLAGRVLLAMEGVNDHENIGSLFRNAAAFGVDGVIVGPGCPDPRSEEHTSE